MRLRDRIGISDRTQAWLSRAMQVVLAGVIGVGVSVGSPKIIVNAAVGLALTFLPAVLERDYRVPMDPGIVLWITSAVFLHAIGTLGPYGAIWWWDHLTHALSASVVAGAGYAAVRAVELHHAEVSFPPRFVAVFILITVLAAGVVWEVLEFGLALLAAAAGTETVLTQHGIDDTMLDLVFDTVGAVLVGLYGEAHLGGLAQALGRGERR